MNKLFELFDELDVPLVYGNENPELEVVSYMYDIRSVMWWNVDDNYYISYNNKTVDLPEELVSSLFKYSEATVAELKGY
jgi:hypothetical protein